MYEDALGLMSGKGLLIRRPASLERGLVQLGPGRAVVVDHLTHAALVYIQAI